MFCALIRRDERGVCSNDCNERVVEDLKAFLADLVAFLFSLLAFFADLSNAFASAQTLVAKRAEGRICWLVMVDENICLFRRSTPWK